MAIVALVLGGAFAASNESFQLSQAAKERDIALHVAETQVERIRGLKLQTSNPTIADRSCITNSLAIIVNPGALPALPADTLDGSGGGVYNASCIQNESSNTFVAGSGVAYHVFTEVNASEYTVHVRWLRFGGGQNQEIVLRYRVY